MWHTWCWCLSSPPHPSEGNTKLEDIQGEFFLVLQQLTTGVILPPSGQDVNTIPCNGWVKENQSCSRWVQIISVISVFSLMSQVVWLADRGVLTLEQALLKGTLILKEPVTCCQLNRRDLSVQGTAKVEVNYPCLQHRALSWSRFGGTYCKCRNYLSPIQVICMFTQTHWGMSGEHGIGNRGFSHCIRESQK